MAHYHKNMDISEKAMHQLCGELDDLEMFQYKVQQFISAQNGRIVALQRRVEELQSASGITSARST